MISINELKNGISIVVDGTLYQVIEFQHIKPGKGAGFVRTRIRNMRTKAVLDKTFKSADKIQDAFIETKKIQFTYSSGSSYFFMDAETFEEIHIDEKLLVDNKKFLKEGMEILSMWHEHDLVDVNLPTFVILKIKNTEPGIKGDTAKSSFKPAELENGAVIQVPLFVNPGDSIKIDTRTGNYVERA